MSGRYGGAGGGAGLGWIRLSAPSMRTRSTAPGAATGVKPVDGIGKASVADVAGADPGRAPISIDWLPISTAARCCRATGGLTVSVSVVPTWVVAGGVTRVGNSMKLARFDWIPGCGSPG